jgi:CheY-like chemotaxis protein
LLFLLRPDILISLAKKAYPAIVVFSLKKESKCDCPLSERGWGVATTDSNLKMKVPVAQILAKKKRILIVEDEYSASKFLSMRLKNLGFTVTAAFDGVTGLKEATETVPDLIILDLMIPKLPGEEVCKALRESFDEKLVKIPIIMLTGKDSMVDKILGKVIGADAYLTKPYDFQDLFDAIKKILPDS